MREIRFRAWEKYRKKMHQDVSIPCNDIDDVNPWIVMQYTGLKDKRGKEIYEGDIVKHTYRAWMDSGSCGHAYYSNIGEVFYDEEFGSFRMKRQGGGNPDFGLYVTSKMPDFGTNLNSGKKERMQPETNEVLGNVYENPELLAEVNRKMAEEEKKEAITKEEESPKEEEEKKEEAKVEDKKDDKAA